MSCPRDRRASRHSCQRESAPTLEIPTAELRHRARTRQESAEASDFAFTQSRSCNANRVALLVPRTERKIRERSSRVCGKKRQEKRAQVELSSLHTGLRPVVLARETLFDQEPRCSNISSGRSRERRVRRVTCINQSATRCRIDAAVIVNKYIPQLNRHISLIITGY